MITKHGRFYRLDIWVKGKRIRRSLGTSERALAIERARDIERELLSPRPAGVPFAEFSKKYLEWARQSKPASVRTEDCRI